MTQATDHYGAADIRYIVDFDAHASPGRLHLALALADTAWAPADRDRLTVLDIGCGRGTTAILLAAANPGWEVIGLDLQPAHVAEMREIALEAGIANFRALEADLAELDEARAGRLLPEVDIVICRGVWTWVPDEVRRGIVGLLRSRLRPGGVVMMGYNALPGFSIAVVLQRLLQEGGRGAHGSIAERGRQAIWLVERLREIGSPYLPPPRVLDRMIGQGRASPAYLAHEWLTGFWRPVFHADLARDLAAARLDYAGPVRASTAMAELQLTPAQQDLRAGMPASMHPETTLDLFLERRFRTDLFVRGGRPGGCAALGGIRFALMGHPEHAAMRLPTQAGEAALPEEQQQALLGALATGPKSLGELAALPACADLTMSEIAVMLAETNTAQPLWREPSAEPALAARAARCNAAVARHFAAEAIARNAPLGAVSHALGGGAPMSGTELALVVALQSGVPPGADALANHLAADPRDADLLAALREDVARVLAVHLDAWRALGVA